MAISASISQANVINVFTETVDLGSVAANTSEEEQITVTGVGVNDIVLAVIPPALSAGIMVGPCRVSAANTVQLQVMNTTAGAIDRTSEAGWRFVVASMG